MKRNILLILGLSLIMTTMSGCMGGNKVFDNMVPQDMGEFSDQSKKYSDTITMGVEKMTDFNPYESMSEGNLQTLRIAYESIFAYDDTLKVVPVLAEDWTTSEDGKQITVTLKEDVKYHNGDSLSAMDVVNTLNLIKTAKYERFYNEIQQVAVVDSKTILVKFLTPQSNPAEKLMFPVVKTTNDGVVGTGPYKFESKESTDSYVFRAFEEYHGMKPTIKEIKMVNAEDIETLLRLFEIGQIDVLSTGVFDYATYSVGAHTNVNDYPTNELVFLGFNFENSIFWGESSRQAMQYLIDKNEIVEKGLYKKAKETDFLINPDSWLYPKDLEYGKDAVLAEKLLLEDSWTRVDGVFARMLDGKRQDFEFDLLVLEDPQLEVTAEMIAHDLSNFGIKCNIVTKPEPAFSQAISGKSYDVMLSKVTLRGSADLETLTGEENIFGYLNSELDKISVAVRTQKDEDALLESYKKYCEISLKDAQFIPLYFNKNAVMTGGSVSENVKCVMDNPYYNIHEWNR